MVKDGKEFWVEVTAEFTGKYFLKIVEKQAMAQDIVANAARSRTGWTTGHAAVYGIYFDTGSPPSSPSRPGYRGGRQAPERRSALKLFVVGHTDTRRVDSNVNLSQARAEAVMQALVNDTGSPPPGCGLRLRAVRARGFERDRDGRAKNRRVELVKQ